MVIKTFIVDDDKSCIDALKDNLKAFPFIMVMGEGNNAKDAIKFLQNNKVDLLFLDIEMEDINGIDLATHIKSTHPDILIIFVTGHPGFALKGYEVYPVDFLTKPINILRLEKALNKVVELSTTKVTKKDRKISMNVSGGIQMININDILYIEKQGRKVAVVCKNEETLYSSDTMKNLESILLSYGFYRTHQSFIVPIGTIKAIHPDKFSRSYSIQLVDTKKTIPLSRSNYQELKEILEKYAKGIIIH